MRLYLGQGAEQMAPFARERPLRCVWTSHPDHEHHCRSRVPADVALAAWRRELEVALRSGRREGFFYFAWRDSIWLAYGLEDGLVRGVYCPRHRAERDARFARPTELDRAYTMAAGAG